MNQKNPDWLSSGLIIFVILLLGILFTLKMLLLE